MTDEVFNRNEADELTLRIADRLGARQEKLERMAAWDKEPRRIQLRPIVVALGIAACLAVVFLAIPFGRHSTTPWAELGLQEPVLEEYRAGMPEMAQINQMLAEHRYADALTMTERALRQSDAELEDLDYAITASDNNDESLLYEEEAERSNNEQLRWTFIFLLTQTERYDEAQVQLKKYLKLPGKACIHKAEAKQLLKRLEKEKGGG